MQRREVGGRGLRLHAPDQDIPIGRTLQKKATAPGAR